MPPRMPNRETVMSDFDGSPQRDDRHHRRSGSRSPFSPGCAGETLAEREERRLAEAAVPVSPSAGQARAASVDPGTCAGRGDCPRRPGCEPYRPAPGGGPGRTGG